MEPVRRIHPQPGRDLSEAEWLVANGLGGYASGTLAGPPTRRYHGVLVAALAAPLGRVVMLNRLTETVRLADGTAFALEAEDGSGSLAEFALEWGLPVWRFAAHGVEIEKRLVMPHGQNTVFVSWRRLAGPAATLEVRPWMAFRPHDRDMAETPARPWRVATTGRRHEMTMAGFPPLRLAMDGGAPVLELDGDHACEACYRVEAERGYGARATLWSPGRFRATLADQTVALTASTEPWHVALALSPDAALAYEHQRRRRLVALADPSLRDGPAAELTLAADAFVVTPRTRVADATRARSTGDELRTVIAGYHWFTDWGRDTMIALEGLTLATGRPVEAGWILRTFAHYVQDGLIPNMFPEHGDTGLYHTADATLWFFHALDRYVAVTGDRDTLRQVLPVIADILDHHRRGTRFGIGVDPADGLLRQGAEGYQLTWMDAKVDDWVVTPRRGKAVEINALWYNALAVAARWFADAGDADAARLAAADAERARHSFNRRFWNDRQGFLFDVVDGERGDDPACRPNQVFAVSLPRPVLEQARWQAVVDTVQARLLTPVGLRSLAPAEPDYKPRYWGDLRSRDAAYHQGTVWAWLIGPFVDAWLKVHPGDLAGARRLLEPLAGRLDEFGTGTIAEVFDAEPPFAARGCIAQAWSVAEWLRAWAATAGHA
ncbi:MAG: amylo-alpha-1,6-glucosidase [Actinomycetota bacterium]